MSGSLPVLCNTVSCRGRTRISCDCSGMQGRRRELASCPPLHASQPQSLVRFRGHGDKRAAADDAPCQHHYHDMDHYGAVVTDKVAQAHGKVVGLALNGAQTERKAN